MLSFMLAMQNREYFIDRDGKHFRYILNFMRVCDCLVVLDLAFLFRYPAPPPLPAPLTLSLPPEYCRLLQTAAVLSSDV